MPAPADAEVKKEEGKTRLVFKHETTPADKIAISGPTPIQMELNSLPEFKITGGWRIPPRRVSRLLIALAKLPPAYGDKTTRLDVLDYRTMRRDSISVPNDFEFNALTGRQGQVMLEKLAKYREDHLDQLFTRWYPSFGSDPEIFVEAGGKLLPAFKFLGSKQRPDEFSGGLGTVYWDGFQAEFTTSPGSCIANHGNSLRAGLSTVLALAKKKKSSAKFHPRTVIELDPGTLEKADDEHVQFGCAPSLNLYGLKPAHLDGRQTPFRFAGGHIHFGDFDMAGKDNHRRDTVIRALDAMLALPCVSLFAGIDNPIRRQFYGFVGEYRLPPHGLEYRTLSNAWLFHPTLYHLTFELARLAYSVGKSDVFSSFKFDQDEVVRIVQESDVDGARRVLSDKKEMFSRVLRLATSVLYESVDTVHLALMKGAQEICKDVEDISGNWKLTGAADLHHLSTWKFSWPKIAAGEKV